MGSSYEDALDQAKQQKSWHKVDLAQLQVGDPIAFNWGEKQEEIEGYFEGFGSENGQVTISVREWKKGLVGKGREVINTYNTYPTVITYRTWKLPPTE